MKKNLLVEIHRMYQIMGLNPKPLLIMEAGPVIPETAAENAWRAMRNAFRKSGERTIEKGLEEITEKELEETIDRMKTVVGEDSVKPLEEIMSKRLSTTEKSLEIARVFETNKILADEIMDKLKLIAEYGEKMNKVFDEFFEQPEIREEMYEMYKQSVERTAGDVEEANKTMRVIWEKDLGKDRLNRFFETTEVTEKNGEVVIEPKNKVEPEISPEEDPNIENITDEAVDELNKIPKGSDISQSYIPTWLRFFYKYWKYMFTKNKKLIEKTKETMKIIETKMEKTPPENVEIDIEDLYMQILGLRKSRTTEVLPMMNKILFQNPKLSVQARKILQSKTFEASKTALEKSEVSNTYGPIEEEIKAFMQSYPVLNFVEKVLSDNKLEKGDLWKLLFGDLKRSLNMIAWKDPRSTAEVVRHLTQFGRNRALASKAVTFVVAQHILTPFLIASIKGIASNVNYQWNKTKIKLSEELCDNLKKLYPNDESICDKMSLAKKPTWDDFYANFKKALPFDYFGLNKEAGNKIDLWKNAFFWTYLDEIASLMKDAWEGALMGDINIESIDSLSDRINPRIQADMRAAGWDSSKSMEENLRNLEKHADLAEKFTKWCLDNNKQYKDFQIQSDIKDDFGTTSDNKQWVYNEQLKTFVEKTSPNPQPVVPTPKPVTVKDKIKNSDEQWLDFVKNNNLQNRQLANDSSGIYKSNTGQYYYCSSKKTFIPDNKDFCAECPNDCP